MSNLGYFVKEIQSLVFQSLNKLTGEIIESDVVDYGVPGRQLYKLEIINTNIFDGILVVFEKIDGEPDTTITILSNSPAIVDGANSKISTKIAQYRSEDSSFYKAEIVTCVTTNYLRHAATGDNVEGRDYLIAVLKALNAKKVKGLRLGYRDFTYNCALGSLEASELYVGLEGDIYRFIVFGGQTRGKGFFSKYGFDNQNVFNEELKNFAKQTLQGCAVTVEASFKVSPEITAVAITNLLIENLAKAESQETQCSVVM